MYNQRILIARDTRDMQNRITTGKQYTTLKGIEDGIFECRPFVTVIDDNGKKLSCHYSRFMDITDKKEEK